jgi:hypothetical protein
LETICIAGANALPQLAPDTESLEVTLDALQPSLAVPQPMLDPQPIATIVVAHPPQRWEWHRDFNPQPEDTEDELQLPSQLET